jgi:hypothetical protein
MIVTLRLSDVLVRAVDAQAAAEGRARANWIQQLVITELAKKGVADVVRDGSVQHVSGGSLPRRLAPSRRKGSKGVGADSKSPLDARKAEDADVRSGKRGVPESGRSPKIEKRERSILDSLGTLEDRQGGR